jgi:hypothetical protein
MHGSNYEHKKMAIKATEDKLMCSALGRWLTLAAIVVMLPELAFAQAATITGVVKDASGALLPGVTVEAASPVLIEKVRSVVSDGSGQYRIVSLPPGTYTVTFTLTGFAPLKHEGIVLSGNFVATVNADLRVGDLTESVTVTGESPIVDVQSTKTETIVTQEVLAAIPSSRSAIGIQALIPGMNVPSDAGGASVTASTGGSSTVNTAAGAIHGSKGNDSNVLNDGLTLTYGGVLASGGANANIAGSQEVVVTTAGGLGESDRGGVIVNLIPREGGNTLRGSSFYSGSSGGMQGSNYTQSLKDAGLLSPQEVVNLYDFNAMVGGKIIRDRLWFFETFRVWGGENTIPGIFWNNNAGDLTKWTYDPDPTRPASVDNQSGTMVTNLTWQATPRNKVGFFWSENWNNGATGTKGGAPLTAPEAQGLLKYRDSRVIQGKWASPVTSKLLLEAAAGVWDSHWSAFASPREDGTFKPENIRVTDIGGSIPGITYRSPNVYNLNTVGTHAWRASATYVTGAHNMKFGYQGGLNNPLTHSWWARDDGITAYTFRNGLPTTLTLQAANPGTGQEARYLDVKKEAWLTGLYAQDQWTRGRLTLQGGLRFDLYRTTYPEQSVQNSPYVPVPIVYPEGSTRGLNWKDITPRMGAAYDMFGNGKTALKFHANKFPLSISLLDPTYEANPLLRLSLSTTRSWNDTPGVATPITGVAGNGNFIPDCDLTNPAANGECGPYANQNFGKNVPSNTVLDPEITSGWNARPYSWDIGISVQQEILPRVSLNAGYFRRWFGNFATSVNNAVTAADFDTFSIVAPSDPRLPNGGGQTISNLYNVKPEKFSANQGLVTSSDNFGEQIENWHGVDLTVNARVSSAFTVQGGWSAGRLLTDTCEIRAVRPEIAPTNPYCRVEQPFLHQFKGLATYLVPKIDVQVSGTWSSTSGPVGNLFASGGLDVLANYPVPNALIRPSLGRDLSGGAQTATVNLVEPATLFGDRVTAIDFRVAKILKFGRTRTQVGLDVYNLTNTDTPLTYNNNYSPTANWPVPTSILPARYAKISVQFDF